MTFDEEQALASVAKEAITELRRRRRWQIFFRLFWLVIILLIFVLPWINRGDSSKNRTFSGKHIAVVQIEGLIAPDRPANAEDIIDSLKQAFENQNVQAIFLAINSGGGSPVQSGQVYRAIQQMKKQHRIPVYAVIADVGASGAYYIAAAADKIYADPASIVGSIGVISHSLGYRGLADKLGLEPRVFTAGKYKDFLSGDKPLEPAEVAHLQSLLNNLHEQFIAAVREGRGARLHEKEYPDVFSGLFWSGEKAVDIGLIDGLADKYSLAREQFDDIPLTEYAPALSPVQKLLRNVSTQASLALRKVLGFGEQTYPVLAE